MKGPKPKLLSFQDQLPRLPVMDLNNTLKVYLKSVQPLCSPEEYANTEAIVNDFVKGGEGPRLQAMLQAHADAEWAEGRNWLERWWLQFAYLLWPEPLPLYTNVFFYFCSIPKTDHLFQAARLIACFLQGKDGVDQQTLPVEFTGSLPMDMSQHKRAFTTARIPGEQGDDLLICEPEPHIVVLCNHRIFTIPVNDEEGNRLCSKEHEKLLREVWRDAHEKAPRLQHSVGLTSEHRPVWAKWRKELQVNNARQLETIDKAMLCIVLEDDEPSSHDDALRQIAGGNANNRWFDKGLQVIIFRNGLSGMNAEHSPAEATMHQAVFGTVVFDRLRALGPWAYPDTYMEPAGKPTFEEVIFHLPSGMPQALQAAQIRYDEDFADLEVRCLQFREWGADWAKSQSLPIDSLIQMAIQLAWGKMHGDPVACYETSHLRLFKHGRTETVRSTSSESAAWVSAVLNNESPETIKQLFKVAVEAQKKYMLMCMKAKGCDRHLLGLRILAMQEGKMPGIFTDPIYTKSTTFRLSTSTVRTSEVGGFPPVCKDGYGVCYMFWRSGTAIVAAVSARRACAETSAEQFKNEICKALSFIRKNWETTTLNAL